MRNDDVCPFLRVPDGAVRATAWTCLVDGLAEPLADYLPSWDQNTTLHLQCLIDADLDQTSNEIGLPTTALSWALGWYVVETGLVGPTLTRPVLDIGDTPFELMIPPGLTGNTLRLTRRLVLTDLPEVTSSALTAHILGSILWADESTLRLCGTGAAFPIEIVPFSRLGKLAKLARASWYLDLPNSVDTPVLGGLLLLVNAMDAAVVGAVTSTRPSDVQQGLIESMEEGVVEQMITWALSRWDELANTDENSVGFAARALTLRILPNPESWLDGGSLDSMDLHAAIVNGARQLGLGRVVQ